MNAHNWDRMILTHSARVLTTIPSAAADSYIMPTRTPVVGDYIRWLDGVGLEISPVTARGLLECGRCVQHECYEAAP